jgi:uncharacterized protein (DUF885 family)
MAVILRTPENTGSDTGPRWEGRWLPVTTMLCGALMATFLGGCGLGMRGPSAPSPADSVFARSQLESAIAQYWRLVLPRAPELTMAFTGRPLSLPRQSLADEGWALQASLRVSRTVEAVMTDALSPREYATVQALQHELNVMAESPGFQHHDLTIMSPEVSALTAAIEVLRAHPLERDGDADRYLYLLESLAFWFMDAKAALEEKWRRGNTASREVTSRFLARLNALRARELARLLTLGSDRLARSRPEAVEQLQKETDEALRLRIFPSLDSLIAFTGSTYLAAATQSSGLWHLPGGKEYYRHLLRKYSGLELEPEAAHGAGLAQLRRTDSVLASMRARNRWNPNPRALHDSLRHLPRYIGVTPESLLVRLRERQSALLAKASGRFVRAPVLSIRARAASAEEETLHPDGTVLLTHDSAGASATLMITRQWTSPAGMFELSSRVARWGWPGRAYALGYVDANLGRQDFVASHPSLAWTLGWAAYAGALAGEVGTYDEPADAYAHLLHEAFSAALLVVDTGVHYFGWTKAQALATLTPYTLLDSADLDGVFVNRVAATPGRAGVETLGLREMTALRAWMQNELGQQFQLEAWHDEILSLGPVPLPILGKHLEWWAWERQRGTAGTGPTVEGQLGMR